MSAVQYEAACMSSLGSLGSLADLSAERARERERVGGVEWNLASRTSDEAAELNWGVPRSRERL